MDYIKNDVCHVCPRFCKCNREDSFGFCGYGKEAVISRVAPHFWEEPCISGEKGSGTIFFCGCNLGCVYCQNYQISRNNSNQVFKKSCSAIQLADIFLELQNKGVHNINLVTASHFTPVVIEALIIAKPNLTIPVIWNSSGYENAEMIKSLDGLVDVYLPDFKYFSPELSKKYSFAPDYFEKASISIKEMLKQCPDNVFQDSLIQKGVIIRHLVLPGNTGDSKKIFKFIKENFGDNIYISLMCQYIPEGDAEKFSEINRRLLRKEYKWVKDYIIKLGFQNGYIQQFSAADNTYVPDFKEVF